MADATSSGRRTDAGREQRILEIIETARAKRPKFKDEQVTMAHGAGGKATQTLIEGLLVPAFGSEALAELGDAGKVTIDGTRPGADHRQLRRQADPLSRRLDRRAGGERDRQRPRRRRRAAARAQRLAGARGGPARRTTCAPRSRRSRRRREAAGVRDRHRRHQGGRARALRLRCTSAPPGSAGSTRAPSCRPAAIRPGDRVLVSGTIGEHGTAIMLARGELGLDAEIESDTRSLWPAADALLEAAGRGFAACATRPGAASRRSSTSSPAPRRSRSRSQRPTSRCGRRSPARPSSWASTRCTSPTRACWSPSSRPRPRTRRSRRCARPPGCEAAAEIGEVEDRAAGDGAGGDRVRRPAGDGPARRRPAAEDLLSMELLRSLPETAAGFVVPNRGEVRWRAEHRGRSGSGEDRGGHGARHLDDHGARLRRRLGGDDLGDQPEPRGHHHPGDPGNAEGGGPQRRCSPTRTARSSCRRGGTPRRGKLDPVRADRRGLDPEREAERRGPLGGDGRRPRRPASRSRPASGSTAWRRRPPPWSPWAHARPTAASRR